MSRQPDPKRPQPTSKALEATRRGKISDLFGILKRKGQPTLTIEEINEASGPGWDGLDGEDQD